MTTSTSTKVTYGNHYARALRDMTHAARLDFVAEGLPIILASAQKFWDAAAKLADDNPREASVLGGFAEEEAAKALILIDLVRCPVDKVDGRIGRIIRHFYSHLARLIYTKAQGWKPTDVTQLQQYVDTERQAHYLEGGMSEYIMPNWAIYSRESTLYADVEQHEDGVPRWGDPLRFAAAGILYCPPALKLIEALSAVGIFSRPGLQALSNIWGTIDFCNKEGLSASLRLFKLLGARLEAEGLVTEAATDKHVRWVRGLWQIPMYNLDFQMLSVPLEDLEAGREAAYWSEVGYQN